jgi:zinc/manganese transport system permease protein
LYLVFATLIVPALATRAIRRGRLTAGFLLAAAGYAAGLALSTIADLPAGPLIVCIVAALGVALFLVRGFLSPTDPRSRT